MATIKMKRGDSFGADGLLTLNGSPEDLTNYAIRAQVRNDQVAFVYPLVVAKLVQTGVKRGQYSLDAVYGDTVLWQPGTYFCDIEFTLAGVRVSTDTVKIVVGIDYTR